MIRSNMIKIGRASAVFAAVVLAASLAFSAMVDKVIVVVNDEVITQREFNRVFAPIEKTYKQHLQGEELDTKLEEARKGVLEQLINTKVAISYAKQNKVEVDETEVTSRIDKVKAYYGSEEEFLKELKDKGTNYTEFQKEIRDQMLAQQIVEKEVASSIVITPGDIRDLYEKNKANLVSPDAVKVRTIMVRKVDDPQGQGDKVRMEKIIKELDSGRAFATVAAESSEGPFADRGGDMGYIIKGQTLPEIEAIVFSLDKGKKSDIVETQMGYHIFMVEDVRESKPMELAEVSDFLREQLYKRRFQEELMRWMDDKRKNAYIEHKNK